MAITEYINSKAELIAYAKEELGEPVVRVEIDDVQYEHKLNAAIERFVEFADDGANFRLLNLDTSSGDQLYTLDNSVYAVRNVLVTEDYKIDAPMPGRATADMFGSMLVSKGTMSSLDMSTYELTRQKMQELNFMTKKHVVYDYNATTKQLYFLEPPETAVYGIIYYEKIDYSDENSSIYDHYWIKRYFTELCRKQWGTNLMKYEGTVLPGGLQHNSAGILAEAKENIEILEQELETKYQEPIDFFIG